MYYHYQVQSPAVLAITPGHAVLEEPQAVLELRPEHLIQLSALLQLERLTIMLSTKDFLSNIGMTKIALKDFSNLKKINIIWKCNVRRDAFIYFRDLLTQHLQDSNRKCKISYKE